MATLHALSRPLEDLVDVELEEAEADAIEVDGVQGDVIASDCVVPGDNLILAEATAFEEPTLLVTVSNRWLSSCHCLR
jgi:hypothetical protein